MHGMKVLIAKNFIDNLSEETRKGMTEKARAGFYPSYASVGYRNIFSPAGKRIIVPDPDAAPVIRQLYERFESGQYSIKQLVAELNTEGATVRGRKLCSSTVHQILRKRLYMGDFDWNGVTYSGTHEPLVTRKCWERVQGLLDARIETRTRKVKHVFAFSGLVRCGHCGCMMVGEIKKGQYVYYHCTGNRGKCPEPYTPQKLLADEFANTFRDLVISQPVLEWLGDAVLESDRTEHAAREQSIKRLQARSEQIQARINTMYLDKLEARITQEFFDKQATQWRVEQTLWGRPVVVTTAMASGTFLCGNTEAAELFVRMDAMLEISTEHSDFFVRNLLAILVECREVLCIYRPGAFIQGSF